MPVLGRPDGMDRRPRIGIYSCLGPELDFMKLTRAQLLGAAVLGGLILGILFSRWLGS